MWLLCSCATPLQMNGGASSPRIMPAHSHPCQQGQLHCADWTRHAGLTLLSLLLLLLREGLLFCFLLNDFLGFKKS